MAGPSAPPPSSAAAISALTDACSDFTLVENWDKFFTVRGTGDSFEWYAEWPDLESPLLSELSPSPSPAPEILVPGCGSSVLSEKLYDAGFVSITNVDFSKVVIADMLRRHARVRPRMRWRVMDMTQMQFPEKFFDVIIDKGGLDALMEPKVGSKLGNKYLNEVKRVLKVGGKFICLTLAESHVIELLLPEFRFGWEINIQAISNSSKATEFQTFMVTFVKKSSDVLYKIKSSLDSSVISSNMQGSAFLKAISNENFLRMPYSPCNDEIYSSQDFHLGVKGDFKKIIPGRRLHFSLGEEGISTYLYKAVLLDAKEQTETFQYHCGIFIVPKVRAHEWLFTSEEGQWLVVESSKAARLVMVFLDSRHKHASMDYIKSHLSPLVKNLAPEPDDEALIPFMMASDGVKRKTAVEEVTSEITGPMIVEDVVYENAEENTSSETKIFRRLVFQRSVGLVQSEALLMKKSSKDPDVVDGKSKRSHSASKKRGKRGAKHLVVHSFLGSAYHTGIIMGFVLIATQLAHAVLTGRKVHTYIVGLGAGLFPMFLHGCFPSLDIQVVELDPVVADLAKKHFGFTEDDKLQVHIGDGIQFIQELAFRGIQNEDAHVAKGEKVENIDSPANGKESAIKILIVDADSSDLSSGLTCPPENFVEESFLSAAKAFVADEGLFVINLVSRSSDVRKKVVSQLEAVFECLYSLQLEEDDVNEVLFGCSTRIEVTDFGNAVSSLKAMMRFELAEVDVDSEKKLKRIK